MMDRKASKSQLEKLVKYFEQHLYEFKTPSFNEAQARQLLIDPLFEAFGWDIRNKQMLPPFKLEVLPEGRVKTSLGKVVKEEMAEYTTMLEYIADDEYKAEQRMATKKPDYRFRIQGSTKFFVEAKKPSVDLMNNLDSIFQIKRYGFSARVPVSILTDFEEFRVFDCTRKPFYDKPKIGVIKEFDFTYKAYLDEFDKLYDTFSRDAVVAGSIETLQKKYLEKRTGEFALDRSFLDDLSLWRLELAKDLSKHTKNRRILNTYTFNECIQRILDRIVFLRVCEDRNIEEVGTLLAILRLWQDHPALSLYEQFNKLIEQRRPLYNGLLFADHECEQLIVSDKILEKIFKNVNYPLSPYHFDEIGVEILGSIYERFLGKTIRLTQKQVRVEDKPEVGKAGGVYYTPQYIVNYIVDNTVGKLVESKTPKQIEKLRIIDIACGSGSFLLGAFQKLIDYYAAYYADHPAEIKERHGVRDAYEDTQGRLILSARKKREILMNNIYGVDIDPQAVEVTQMSLYLKVLENENEGTLNKPTMLALHEVLLPPLKNNIKCGNSLIGTDFFLQGDLFDNDMRRKINSFDWEVEFPEIMKSDGFDTVIGNPPYVSSKELEDYQKDAFRKKYSVATDQFDLYSIFIEKSVSILSKGGKFGYIIPDAILDRSSATELRKFILRNTRIQSILQVSGVFKDPNVSNVVLVFEKKNPDQEHKLLFMKSDGPKGFLSNDFEFELIKQNNFVKYENYAFVYASEEAQALLQRLKRNSVPLGEIARMGRGEELGKDTSVVSNKRQLDGRKIIFGQDIQRYAIRFAKRFINKRNVQKDEWLYENKIVVRQLGDRINASFDDEGVVTLQSIYSIIPVASYSYLYLLGILNSRVIDFIYSKLHKGKQLFPRILLESLRSLPIRTIDFTKPDEKQIHDELVGLVERMLKLHKQLQKATFESEQEPIQRQIVATDRKIDELVYKLYGLTEEEIRIVEGKSTSGG